MNLEAALQLIGSVSEGETIIVSTQTTSPRDSWKTKITKTISGERTEDIFRFIESTILASIAKIDRGWSDTYELEDMNNCISLLSGSSIGIMNLMKSYDKDSERLRFNGILDMISACLYRFSGNHRTQYRRDGYVDLDGEVTIIQSMSI